MRALLMPVSSLSSRTAAVMGFSCPPPSMPPCIALALTVRVTNLLRLPYMQACIMLSSHSVADLCCLVTPDLPAQQRMVHVTFQQYCAQRAVGKCHDGL